MKKFIAWLDALAETNNENRTARLLDRMAFVFLILTVLSAPHSIAATQTSWLIGMLAWIIRLFIRPRVALKFGWLDIALWAFFVWSVITCFSSYAPDISFKKLGGAAVFLIFYFVFYNLRNVRAVYFLAFALIFSCMVNVLWTPVQRLIGRGVEIHGLQPDSPLAKAGLREGDALLKANGIKLTTPDDLAAEIARNETNKVTFYRPDYEFAVDVKGADLLPGNSSLEQLGIESWNKSRNWRSSGFYGHYTTYAEVLQLIGSLVFGLFVAFFERRKTPAASDVTDEKVLSPRLPFSSSPLLLFCLAAISFALLLTVTRGSQLSFLISAFCIVLIGLSRKWILAAIAIGLPLALIGLFFLQQSRQVGFFDPNDDSIKWRQTVYREGVDLWTESPRHFFLGIGMDTITRYAKEWRLFDDGKLPIGHYHSTPLQLLVERGLPALLLWLIVLGIYARTLWRGLYRQSANSPPAGGGESPQSTGILLGCLGGTIGFFTSGLVHYNLGDQEVAMVFFILMGIGVNIARLNSVSSAKLI